MLNVKSGKHSIILTAVAIMVTALLFAFAGFTAASAEAPTDPRDKFEYIERGYEAYSNITESNLAEEVKADLLAKLDDISEKSLAYGAELAVLADDADLESEELPLLAKYNVLADAVEEYNLAAKTYGENLTVSVAETFLYRGETAADDKSVASDISVRVGKSAYDALAAKAAGWESAPGYDYTVKYAVKAGDAELFYIYDNLDNSAEAKIITLAGAKYIDNIDNAGAGVLNLVIEDEGELYTLILSVGRNKTGTDPETLKPVYEYGVTLVHVYKGSTTDKNAEEVSGRYTAELLVSSSNEAASVGAMLAEAQVLETVHARNDIASVYATYKALISEKIESVRGIAKDLIGDAKATAEADKALYSDEGWAQIESAGEEALAAIEAAASFADMQSALEEGLAEINGVLTVPEQFESSCADLLGSKYYEYVNGDPDCEYNRAVAALAELENAGYGAEILAAVAPVKAQLINNIKETAKQQVLAAAEEVDYSALSDNQKGEVIAERQRALAAIDAAGDNVANVDEALEDFVTYAAGISSSGNFSTKNKLESADGSVTVEGVVDSRATLEAAVGASGEDDESKRVEEGKKTSPKTRSLTVLEIYNIEILVNGKSISYLGGTDYTVTVKLSSETIDKIVSKGVALDSVIVAYVDENGHVETFETTLTLNLSDGTSVVYGEGTDVDLDKITGGTIMFVTQHFSSYSLLGNTSTLGLAKLGALLEGLVSGDTLTYILIALGAVVGVILLFLLISFIVSLCKRYTIKFVSNGGTKVKTIRKKYGKKLPELKVPEKEGYVFTGWCIDSSLKYEFNRTVMPRANVVLYARYLTEEEFAAAEAAKETAAKLPENAEVLVSYYDKLRSKLAGCKKPVVEGERAFVKQEVLAKLYAEEDHVKLYVKTKPENIRYKGGKAYIAADADKYEEYDVYDELTLEDAYTAIERMAKINGLAVEEPRELEPSTYDDAVLGYAYVIKYNDIADYDGRYCALREYGRSFGAAPDKVEPGKLLFELVPDGQDLDLGLALANPDRYADIVETKDTAGKLKSVYVISDGEQMGVAKELIAIVLKENGFAYNEPAERDDSFDTSLAYSYLVAGEAPVEEVPAEPEKEEVKEEPKEEVPAEEPAEAPAEEAPAEEAPVEAEVVEEIPLDCLFKKYRLYVRAFALYADGDKEPDRTNDGVVVLRAKLGEDAIETTLDPNGDAEALTFSSITEFDGVKEKVAAVMAKYGMTHGVEGDVADLTTDIEAFEYKIKFPALPTPEENLKSLRDYVNSFALFAEGEPDKSLDGTVVVKVIMKDGAVAVTLDPDADAQEMVVVTEKELADAKAAVAEVMKKYGLSQDPDYVPAEGAVGTNFGYRIKF